MKAIDIGNISTYKTSDGSGWMAQLTIGLYPNGKIKYKRFRGKKKSEVVEKARSYSIQNLGITDSTETYLEDYLKYYVRNIKKPKLKPASYDREVKTMEKQIIPYIGHYYISQLTSGIIQDELINKLITDKYSYSSIHKAFILLKACLSYAILNGKININPCIGVTKPSQNRLPSKEIRFLSEEELKLVKLQAESLYKTGKPRYKYGLPIILVSYTGMRVGELCALKWSDIDYNNKTIKISKNIVTYYDEDEKKTNENKKTRITIEQDTTKTKNSNRFVPLNKPAIDLLKKLEKVTGGNPKTYIISGTTVPSPIDSISECYTAIATAAKIKNPQGIHTLRHTFASLLVKKGIDIKIISEILGHSNVTITYNLYVHFLLEQKAQAVEMIDF